MRTILIVMLVLFTGSANANCLFEGEYVELHRGIVVLNEELAQLERDYYQSKGMSEEGIDRLVSSQDGLYDVFYCLPVVGEPEQHVLVKLPSHH